MNYLIRLLAGAVALAAVSCENSLYMRAQRGDPAAQAGLAMLGAGLQNNMNRFHAENQRIYEQREAAIQRTPVMYDFRQPRQPSYYNSYQTTHSTLPERVTLYADPVQGGYRGRSVGGTNYNIREDANGTQTLERR